MEFPQFENINEDNNPAANNFNNFADNNEIQIEDVEYTDNKYQGFNDNYNPAAPNNNNNYNNSPWENTPVNETSYARSANDGLNEEDKRRIEEGKAEEEHRRARIMKKMNDELRLKQEFRDKALDYFENWKT